MPTYEYLCQNCGHRFEAFQRMSEDPITECPICNGHVKRLISGGNGLIFKGSGFYITDYKNNGHDTKPKETKPKEKTEASKKTETKTKKATAE